MRGVWHESNKVAKVQSFKGSRCELGVIKRQKRGERREERATVATNRVGFVFIT
jgi:hypothetical protein